MATLVLQAAGQAVGGLLGPVGAVVGRAAGALAGHVIDQRVFGDSYTRSVGRIDDLTVQTGSESNPIPRVYGRMRLAGTVIWATDYEENVDTISGGKGGGPTVREYSYTANFAVGICEGPIARIGRIWADGEPLDLTGITWRVYLGADDQEADPLIEAIEGTAPAYRHTAYVVFEKLPIGPYGNRLPQLTFEVVRPIGELEKRVRAVTLIPGATEFGYHPERVDRAVGPGEAVADNRHLGTAASDFEASIDELMALCPNLEQVALVVAWFGNDLRADLCSIRPCVERRERETSVDWSVAGEDRESAVLVSTDAEGRPSYGGTPSDAAVFEAVRSLKARGLKVVFYPFLLMDVPAGNGLPDPYGGAEQAPFPWRGRISVSPAPGREGSPDTTAAADSAVAAFVGSAAAGDFSADGATISYSGDAEWSLRRMVLHYAHLTAAAGGVDAFLIASEMRGLSWVRGASGYPFVDALAALADDVRAVVGGGTKISYAADWSEYFGHQTPEGDLRFHLDPVWASPNVDFIGIDNYWPLSDWRDGTHLDEAVADIVHDHDYLAGNVAGGEGFDWFYASEADRVAQVRTPITDGAYGKPWVYRYKDIASWWGNLHYDRVAGVEVETPTPWAPGMKPIWFTEVGCPAVDRGANQPNVFYDPKSSESTLPYFSSGRRDDAMQRAYLEAMIEAFDPAFSSDIDRFNPQSGVYGGRMIDPGTIHVWTWDSRPWPAFPHRFDVWSDGANWERGHWLTGRLGGVPVDDLLRVLFRDWGLDKPQIDRIPVVLDGYMVAVASTLRAVLDPLVAATSVVGADTGTGIRFLGLSRKSAATYGRDDLVEIDARSAFVSETRDEASALPVEMRIKYFDSGRAYQIASARFRPQEGSARQLEEIALSGSLNDGLASELAEIALSVRWAGRTTVRFALPLSEIAVMPGDIVTLEYGDRARELIVEEITDLGHREVTARTLDRNALVPTPVIGTPTPPQAPPSFTAPIAIGVNLPIVDEEVASHLPWIAVYARPFPGEMGVWRAAPGGGFQLVRTIDRPSAMGELVSSVGAGPTSRWHYGGRIDVRLYNAAISSRPAIDVLSGANSIAVLSVNGTWEVIQFQTADLIGERTYRLSTLLRGQLGTDDATGTGLVVGAPVVLLNGSLFSLPTPAEEVGLARTYRVGPLAEGLGGRNVTTFAFTPSGRGLLPYSPVHAAALRNPGNGALTLSWIRRSRIGGDTWPDGTDIPLGESSELYRLDILDGGVAVRTVEVTSPTYTYSLANQTADFGAAPDPITFRVAQIAPGFGPGVPYEVTVDVKQP
ncbi:glycoside hydrolase/phage tail family protein [Acuticoccus sp. M5D2P5]|uniref:baseplate multidomain protein megatron n=1 Tax=Acuticoccus kalidii TaxID=2910977 RepID=UPI001F2BA73A|nr:glycoside hydrolase/phage tail family protein [Acuticoccus kalidii]MCF3934451.1 glycoside hydrolase/phage tail family protein [Acuticoccus kalidii]